MPKKTTAKRKELDAAKAARDAALAKEAAAKEKVDGANVRCAEAEANYTAAQEALTAAEAKVATAQAEVDTAMNGIHQKYQTCIEQTAQSVKISATKVTALDTKVSSLEVKADNISTNVSTLDSKTQALMKATNMTQTDSGFTWSIVDNTARNAASDAASTASSAASTASSAASTANSAYSMAYNIINGTGTLTLGGSATAIEMGGTSSTIYMGGSSSSIMMADTVTISAYRNSTFSSYNLKFTPSRYPATYEFDGGIWTTGSLRFTGSSNNIINACQVLCNTNSSAGFTNGRHGLYSGTASKWLSWANSSGECFYHGDASSPSSRFVKYDITNEDVAKAESLLGVDVVRFKYKAGFRNGFDDNSYHYGVIAEDVYSDFPDVVTNPDKLHLDALIPTGEDTSGIGVDYSKFVPHLIKLCQMQQAQIDGLKARVEALEANQTTTE